MRGFKLLVPAMIVGLLIGCGSTGSYDSSSTYNKNLYGKIALRASEYEGVARNPVIVIHGFLGARLQNTKTGQNVWGSFSGWEILAGLSDSQLRDFSHPMGLGKPLKALTNDVNPVGLLDQVNVRLLGYSFELNEYGGLLDLLRRGGYYDEKLPLPSDKHFASLFVFYYDWRRDLPENAARLQQFITQKRAYMQQQYEKYYHLKNYDVQFDLIAHSMGGLLARYYLRYGNQDLPADGALPKLDWRGHNYIDKLMIVGTPNQGYLDTVMEMNSGLQVAFGAPTYPPAVIGTFPTYYQMMPAPGIRAVLYADNQQGREVDLFDPAVWIALKWGIVNPEQDKVLQVLLPQVSSAAERRKIAIDHLTKCLKRAKQFAAAMNVKGVPPDDVALFLFAGDAVQTRRTAVVDRRTGKLSVIETEPGDGKVLASSARADWCSNNECPLFLDTPIKWTGIYHLKAAHMGLTNSGDFANNASFLMLLFPTRRQDENRNYYHELAQPLKL